MELNQKNKFIVRLFFKYFLNPHELERKIRNFK